MTTDLAPLIIELNEALDPDHQGACWPDVIAWGPQDLREAGRDALALVDAETAHDRGGSPSRVGRAALALLAALGEPLPRWAREATDAE